MNVSHDDRLTALIDGELDAAEASALQAELAADPELARSLEALRRTRELVRRHGPVRAPSGYADRVLEAIEDEAPRTMRVLPWAAVAVAAAATLVLWVVVRSVTPEAPPAGVAASPDAVTVDVTAGAEVLGVASRYRLEVDDAAALDQVGAALVEQGVVSSAELSSGTVVLTLEPGQAESVLRALAEAGALEAAGPAEVRSSSFPVVLDVTVRTGAP